MNDSSHPDKKVVWITGASQGIGEALVHEYTRQGWLVFASARSAQGLSELCEAVRLHAGLAVPIAMDISSPESVAQGVQRMLAHSSMSARAARIDCVILNAGTHIAQRAIDVNTDEFAQLVQLNLLGTSYCIAALMPQLLQQEKAQLAIMASLAGYRGLPNAWGYGATKAALINMAESLRCDLSVHNIDVRVINPGFVKTPLTDKNSFAMPDIIDATAAAKIIFQGLNRKGFEIRFPWRFAWIMRLLSLLPYRLYFFLIKRITG
jgi:NAD(P)-dependent dehydrogenase (short-subunit alcohol dehydrogenase family)